MNSIILIFTHFLCDWVLQPRGIAEKKSSHVGVLLLHLAINSIGFALATWAIGTFSPIALLLNALAHGVIDWNIWRLYKNTVFQRISRKVYRTEALLIQRKVIPILYFSPKEEIEQAKLEWKDKNLYAKDYWFYLTIALDQFLHLAIAMSLFL